MPVNVQESPRSRRRIGTMRMQFIIETPVDTANALGGGALTWQAGEAVWGRIEAKIGSESVIADRVEARVLHRIVLRHRPGLGAGMRLRAGARLFEIIAAFDPDGASRDLVCQAEEIVQ